MLDEKSTFDATIEHTMSELSKWIAEQIDKRGWTQNELARRAGVSSGHLSLVVTEKQQPGWEFCAKIAKPLGKSPEWVFRKAGLLAAPSSETEITIEELRGIIHRLTPDQQRDLLWYAAALYDRSSQQKRGGDK